MKSEGFDGSGTKEMLIDNLIKSLNSFDSEEIEEKQQLIASYHNFLLKTIKHNNNRIVITYPIITTQHSSYYSENSILDQFDVNSLDSINFSSVISGENLKKTNFTEIFKHIKCTNGITDLIEVCYGRINKYKRNDDTEVTAFEYAWCEIDPQEDALRIILSENPRNFIKDNSHGSRSQTQKMIVSKLKREFNLVFNSIDEKQTLFKIYKYLTAHIEEPYAKLVNPYTSEIIEFANSMKKRLLITDTEDIDIAYRIQKLLERNLIQKDFRKFRTKKVDDGRVKSINYSDTVGGSVKANSGGSYFNGQRDQELDLQDSGVYFDTKESIYSDKELAGITVSRVNKSELVDDRFDDIEVRYIAYRGFYITHFLRYNVREEIYDYVLSRFDEYKRKPL